MITFAEIQRSLIGAWQLFLGRPDAMRAFDTSDDGFWRSFQAVVLIVPIYWISASAELANIARAMPEGAQIDGQAFWISKAAVLALDWLALPVVLAALAGFLRIKQRYGAFIVVRNWSTVLAVAPFGVVALLDLFGLVPGETIAIPSLIALGFALRMGYMAARTALALPVDMAIGLVAFDFLLSMAILTIADRLFNVLPG